MAPDDELPELLFEISLTKHGVISTRGCSTDKLPYVLRIIADSLEAGDTKLDIVNLN